MKTPDETKRRFAEAIEEPFFLAGCVDHDLIEARGKAPASMADALAYIRQMEAQAPKWISVEERLPESSACVIAICDDGFMILTSYYGGHWNWNGRHEDSVTHWMPLPEPPKEDDR